MRGMALVNAAMPIAENWATSRASAIPASSCPISGLSPASIPVVSASDTAICTYRSPARLSRELLLRQEVQASPIREIVWKTQLRRCALSHVFPQRQASQYRHCRDRPWAGCFCSGLRRAAQQSVFAKRIRRAAYVFAKRIRRTSHQPPSRPTSTATLLTPWACPAIVIPAKAGFHCSRAWAVEGWAPTCVGATTRRTGVI